MMVIVSFKSLIFWSGQPNGEFLFAHNFAGGFFPILHPRDTDQGSQCIGMRTIGCDDRYQPSFLHSYPGFGINDMGIFFTIYFDVFVFGSGSGDRTIG
jgi:hypothetical protein